MSQSLPPFPPEADFRDLDAVAGALAALVPAAKPIRPLGVLGSGYFSLAVETASGFVFRLACTESVVERHEKEVRLLPWLAPRLPLAIPQPTWRIEPCEALPYGAIVYRKLQGRVLTSDVFRELDQDQLVEDLARFLLALHTVPLSRALEQGVSPLGQRRTDLERLRANVLAILEPRLSAERYGCVVGGGRAFSRIPRWTTSSRSSSTTMSMGGTSWWTTVGDWRACSTESIVRREILRTISVSFAPAPRTIRRLLSQPTARWADA